MPTIKKLEHTVHTNKESIYDHIEASNRALSNRMDQLDKRTTEHVHNIDRFTKDRFIEEEHNCRGRIQQRIEEEREYMRDHYHENLRLDMQDWLEAKLGTYGHCLDHHHDDTALPNNNIFTDVHHTENGRLFKSRSDETLSQSDNHSGKFRKRDFYESRQAAMQSIRAWQLPIYGKDRPGRTRDINDNVRNVNDRSQGGRNPYRGQGQYQGQGHGQRGQMQYRSQQNGGIYASHNQVPTRNEPMRRSNVNFSSKEDILSPSTESTNRSPYAQSPNDPVYGHYGQQGAIPKRMPQSQTWHSAEQWRNGQNNDSYTASAYNKPKSSESTQHGQPVYGKVMVRSKTDSDGFVRDSGQDKINRHHNEQFQRNSTPRQSAPERSQARTQDVDNSKMFHKNSDTRQSFQERGSLNTSTGTNPMTLTSSASSGPGQGPQDNSRPSSGKSDKSDQQITPKPTFTTFGYEEKKTPQSISNSVTAENNVTRPGSSMRQENPYGYLPKRSQTPNDHLDGRLSRNGGQLAYGHERPKTPQTSNQSAINSSIRPSQNKDDAHPVIPPKPILRQRTRSSEGLLLDDGITSAHDMAQRSRSEERMLDSAPQGQRSYTPQTPRSASETRPQNSHPVNSACSNISNKYPRNSQSPYSGYSNTQSSIPTSQHNGSNSSHSQHFNSQNQRASNGQEVHSVYVQMKRPDNVNSNVYGSNREMSPASKDSNYGLRENPYASVRNVSQYKGNQVQYLVSKQGVPYHSSYNVNYANEGKRATHRESSPVVNFSKSEPNLDRSLNDSDHDAGYTSPVNPRADYATCRSPTGESSASKDQTKIVANYPNAYNKEDSSSNPDSGYSSKIFGARNAGNVPSNSGTPSSSFSTDHDHSMSIPSNNNSPHPQVSHSDYEQIQNVRLAAQRQTRDQNLQNHVESWYQKKLQEAAQRLREGPYNKQGDSPPTALRHNQYSDQYHYGQPPNNQSQYSSSHYQGNKDYVNSSNYQRIFIRGSDV